MTDVSSLHTALPAGIDGGPTWVQLLPLGTFSGVDGRGPYHLRDAQAVITASMQGENPQLAVDENHSTDLAGPLGQPSPARGWITRMEARPDGIYGLIEWNSAGRALMADRAYRGVSPVFTHAKDGTVIAVLRLSLTNTPNLSQLALLHHQQDASMDLPALRTALALPDTADEAAILAAVRANIAAVGGHATQLQSIAAAAGVQATDATALITALQAQRTVAGDAATLGAQVTALQAQVQQMHAASSKATATAFVDAAITLGKPIVPLRDHYIARHQVDAAGVEKEVNAMVSINGNVVTHARKEGMSDEELMSAEDRAVCSKMGLDPKKFAENKKKMTERDGVAA